ncbi:MAG TPA: ATP-binding protein [Ktedonobacterales bacterium]|nr:ATP-binding protein [Ktedonobacterales bacterium]
MRPLTLARQRTQAHAESLLRRARALRQRLPWAAPLPVADPSAALFTRVRRRLTLQYTAALGILLLVAGALLYLGVRGALLGQVPGYLSGSAQQISAAWQNAYQQPQRPGGPLPGACPIPESAAQHVPYIECFGPLGASSPSIPAILPDAFKNPNLARAALTHADGQASDTVYAAYGLGAIQRYALVVRDADSQLVIGIVMVGVPVEGQRQALAVLLVLLLVVGGLMLLGSLAGGLLLAARALAPARLAFARQQAFIADASHELRTPLTLLRADAEVLLRGRARLTPDDAELLEDVVTEAGHMGVLLTNLLTLARLDAGTVRPERDVVDLGEVADQALRRVHALADDQRITLTRAGEDHLLVVADRALLEQAALILVDNAIKYNRPDGAVTITLTRAADRALLAVRDSGIGVAPEHLAHLGERFYRVDKARSREAGGAGLGLSIARGIAAAHDGTLTLASAPGEGTTATLALPTPRAVPPAGPLSQPLP